MSQVNLKRLLKRKEVSPIISNIIKAIGAPISIYDAKGNLLIGDEATADQQRSPIEIGEETIGWITGISASDDTVISLIRYLANKEIEQKRLASEVLNKYTEINLFYELSEKITANLEIPAVIEIIAEKARRLVKATSGTIMLLNEETGVLEVNFSFGIAHTSNIKCIKPGEGIAGAVFASGRGEIVNDAASDPRFIAGSNPVGSIICAPLKTRDRVLGVINFSNAEPVEYTAEDLQLMQTLAAQAAQAIENAVLQDNKVKDALARYEIEKGQKMQRDFLPAELKLPPEWELSALFKPARQVAGDFYDSFMLPSGGIGVVIADVCDKGVGSALFMALFRSLIRVFSTENDLGSISITQADQHNVKGHTQIINLGHVNALGAVKLTNDYVADNHSNLNMFATLFFGIIDPKTGLLTYVNGGHEPLVIIGEDGIKSRLMPTGPAVGMLPQVKFRIQQIELEPGDTLLGYTDGVTEAKSPTSKFFTEERLVKILEHPEPDTTATQLLDRIDRDLMEHIADADQFDDITMIAVRRCPKDKDKETK
jgi:sigma-B regulation protein RsbU (phosphoserine phosphatase)